MERLFKYLPSKYLHSFVGKGEVLFRSLSYYSNYEEMQVRGDRNEGKRVFSPSGGLEVTSTATGKTSLFQGVFESTVQDRDIFVFCMSKELSPELAIKFTADVCVEIVEPALFLSRIRTALQLRKWVTQGRLIHGLVDYYSPETKPLAEWAVPERMVMRKTSDYNDQAEYRLAFARGNALQVENVIVQITAASGSGIVLPTLDGHPEHTLKLGSLKKICKVHRFK
ncbi:hypothetical protein [Pseudomonas fragi]|uniref:hypothetical protein n=1 Tax=Pseudomonas fragi TaxID=296 RepID=UPI001472A1C8|nr:hypothetical protein [Pseudomonas fragi]NNA99743.1 hypothetical protein [Pseudomonas fragi]